MTVKTTPMAFAVHRAESHPVFGAETTTITVEDEAAGFFYRLSQNGEREGTGSIWVDLEELKALYEAALLLSQGEK